MALKSSYESNRVASSTDPRSGMENQARLDISGEEESERQSWSVSGDFRATQYQHDLFDDNYDADARANYQFRAIPDVLDWDVDYVESVQLVDPAAPDVPSNTESVRLVGTGPTLTLQLLGHNELRLSARRQRITNERTHYFRDSASAGLWRTIRPRHQIYARSEWSATDYMAPTRDYRNRRYLAGYTYLSARSQLTVEGGRGFIKEEQDEMQESDIGSVRFSWRMPGARTLNILAQQEFGDEAGDLLAFASGNLVATSQGTNPFRDRSARLTYSGSDFILDPLVSVWQREKRFLRINSLSRDTDESGVRILSRLYNEDTGFVSLSATGIRREFLDTQRQDDDLDVTLAGTRILSERFEITLGVSHFERRSSDASVEYDNDSIYLELRRDL